MSKAGYEVRDGIAALTLENPPVNSVGLELRRSIVGCMERTTENAAVSAAVVIIGAGAGFSGGADIREFGLFEVV